MTIRSYRVFFYLDSKRKLGARPDPFVWATLLEFGEIHLNAYSRAIGQPDAGVFLWCVRAVRPCAEQIVSRAVAVVDDESAADGHGCHGGHMRNRATALV